jgi:mannose-6-phosphate isomerase-like protein (cupin superfamily)
MKLFSLSDTPYASVIHDPNLKKRILVPDNVLSCIRHISHIILPKGSKASLHKHLDTSEVFYCIRGTVIFSIKGTDTKLQEGQCLIVEPGEHHSIEDTPEETELVYFMAGGSNP